MRVPQQFNVAPVLDAPGAPDWFRQFSQRYQQSMKRIGEALTGPVLFNVVALDAAETISLKLGDLIAATLIVNTTITIALDQRGGAEGMIELMQDGVGLRTVAWVNVLWAGSTPPVVASGAGKRTLLGFTCVGSAWVGRVIASNY